MTTVPMLDLLRDAASSTAPFAVVIDAALRGTVLLLLALVATRLLRQGSAATRHAVWTAALLGQLALPIFALALPAWRVAMPSVAAGMVDRARAIAAPNGPRAAPVDIATPHEDGSRGTGTATAEDASIAALRAEMAARVASSLDDAAANRGPTEEAIAVASAQRAPWTLLESLALVWLAGAAILLARLLAGSLAVRRLARRASPVKDGRWLALARRIAMHLRIARPLTLLGGDRLSVPVTWGILSPVVLLPAEADRWPLERRRLVLLHELAHVKRWDALTQLLGQVALAVFWFHPLVWRAVRAMRAESERACDDCVLRAGMTPSTYVNDLVAMVRGIRRHTAGPAHAALAMARTSEFEGRMLAILDTRARRNALGRSAGVLTAAAALLLAMPLAAMHPVATIAGAAVAPSAAGVEDVSSAEPSAQRASDVPGDDMDADAEVDATAMAGPDAPDDAESAAPHSATELMMEPEHVTTLQQEESEDAPDDSRRAAAVNALALALRDSDVSVRRVAVQALGELDDPRAVEALVRALREDADEGVRKTAAWALGEIESPAAVDGLAAALRTEKSAEVRRMIVWALGEIEDERGVAAAASALRDANVEVRRTAVWALGEIESPAAVTHLAPLLKDGDVEMRRNAAQALGEIESEEAVEPLGAALRDADAGVRATAAWALGEIEDPSAATALGAALKDANVDVRRKAAWALGELGLERAPPALIEALRDADRDVRRITVHALGEIEDPAAVAGLGAIARGTGDVELRREALHALAEIRDPAALEILIAAMKDEDPQIRRIAAEALGKNH